MQREKKGQKQRCREEAVELKAGRKPWCWVSAKAAVLESASETLAQRTEK